MTKTPVHEFLNLAFDKLDPLDETRLAAGILSLVSQFFAEARNLDIGDRRYVVVSSDEAPPERESFIDVVSCDNPGRVVRRYALIIQKISR